MALHINELPAGVPDTKTLDDWLDIPAAIISDELNRFGAMDGGIKPLADSASFAGYALPVRVMPGDNAALHYAAAMVVPGMVIVVDAGGFLGSAVWGGILQRAAEAKGAYGVVVDGAIRDRAELRVAEAPVYARGYTPNGPQKGWGGNINHPIQCGGCPVAPGDLVRGDDDGVVVVPRAMMGAVLAACRDRLAMEQRIEDGIAGGKTTVELLNLPAPEDF
jgi:4-hydroxy-4-methyl-2-oxoglutarate aldolase